MPAPSRECPLGIGRTGEHSKAVTSFRTAFCLALILGLCALVYAPHLSHPFQFDDLQKIVDNPRLGDPIRLFQGFRSGVYSEDAARLVPKLSFSLDHALYGLRSTGYHATNLLIHLINVALVLLFARRILGWTHESETDRTHTSLCAAALFALHPLNSEAVLYCNARPNTLSTLFILATLLCWLSLTQVEKQSRWIAAIKLAGFAGFGVCALLTKEMAVMIVPLGLLMWVLAPPLESLELQRLDGNRGHEPSPGGRDSVEPGSKRREHLAARENIGARQSFALPAVRCMSSAPPCAPSKRAGLLLFGLAAACLAVVMLTGAHQLVSSSVTHFKDTLLYQAGQTEVFFRYLLLTFLPLPSLLNVDHHFLPWQELLAAGSHADPSFSSFGQHPLRLTATLLSAAGLVVLGVFAWRYRRKAPALSLLLAWPLLAHAPTSLVPRSEQMVEYRTYLPNVGLCILFACLFHTAMTAASRVAPLKLLRPKSFGIVIVISLCCVGVHSRAQAWASQVRLWEDTLMKSPGKWRVLNNLGHAYQSSGQLDKAYVQYDASVDLDPAEPKGYYNRANVKALARDYGGAIDDYSRCIDLDPRFADAFNARGKAFIDMGAPAASRPDFELAIQASPSHFWAFANRATASGMTGELKRAREDVVRALEIRPDFPEALSTLGNLHFAAGETSAAVASYTEALKLKPDFSDAYLNRANASLRTGNQSGAISDFESALRTAPPTWPHRGRVETILSQLRK